MTTMRDIIWIAGILEGEGWIGFRGTPSLKIGMTDLDVIEKVKAVFKTDRKIQVTNSIRRKTCYTVTIEGVLAIQWMMTIYPLMGDRRKARIKEIIGQWKSMPGRGMNYGLLKSIAGTKGITVPEARKLLNDLIYKPSRETIQ